MIDEHSKYKTISGHHVKIVEYNAKGRCPIVGIVYMHGTHYLRKWDKYGKNKSKCFNLERIIPWNEFKVDQPILVRDDPKHQWVKAHFAGVVNGFPAAWTGGKTSFTVEDGSKFGVYIYAQGVDDES